MMMMTMRKRTVMVIMMVTMRKRMAMMMNMTVCTGRQFLLSRWRPVRNNCSGNYVAGC